MVDSSRIRVIAVCLFRHGNRILVLEGFDTVKGSFFYRPLGGAVEFGETTRDAIVREIREEIGQEMADVRLVTVLENLFTCDGQAGHEVVFVYDARLVDEAVYRKTAFEGTEDGQPFKVVWHSLESFDEQHRLVPEALWGLVRKPGGRD